MDSLLNRSTSKTYEFKVSTPVVSGDEEANDDDNGDGFIDDDIDAESSRKLRELSEFDDDYDVMNFEFDYKEEDYSMQTILQQYFHRMVDRVQKPIKETIKENVETPLKEARARVTRIRTTLETRLDEQKKKIQTPPFLRLIDRIAFVCGVSMLLLTQYLLLRHPHQLPLLYQCILVVVLVYRYFDYHSKKIHGFLLDYCYFVQLLLIHFLHVSYRIELFQILFALVNGPLVCAIILWSNSLVFHDLDKLTSLFIHFFPAIVTYGLRWCVPFEEQPRRHRRRRLPPPQAPPPRH